MQLKWPYFINLIPSGHHEVQYTSLSLTTRKTVYREWLTSYLPLSKYFFKNTTGALLFVVYNAFFLAHITADQLPFWMQGFVFLSFHYHPNDMIVRRNPLLQKLADDTKKKKKISHTSQKTFFSLDMLSILARLAVHQVFPAILILHVVQRNYLKMTHTLAFVYSFSTNLCFCICIYWCLEKKKRYILTTF